MTPPPFDPIARARELELFDADDRGSPHRAVLTQLGYVWFEHETLVPSAAIVEILNAAGISPVRTRAALSRMKREGILRVAKAGRRTMYELEPDRAASAAPGVRRILSFGASDDWDGHWCVVAFSIPEERKDARHQLRTRLQWLGFAPLYDGLWICPTHDPEPVRLDLERLRIDAATVFIADDDEVFSRERQPIDAWSLEPVRQRYGAFLEYCASIEFAADAGAITPSKAMGALLILTDIFRQFPRLDPQLPASKMPDAWPRAQAYAAYANARTALHPLADIKFDALRRGATASANGSSTGPVHDRRVRNAEAPA